MPEPLKPNRRFSDLVAFFGAQDEIAPVNRHIFARKMGEIIARALSSMKTRKAGRRGKRGQDRDVRT
jgi:hypothetical protein